jgi:hypothetical protein
VLVAAGAAALIMMVGVAAAVFAGGVSSTTVSIPSPPIPSLPSASSSPGAPSATPPEPLPTTILSRACLVGDTTGDGVPEVSALVGEGNDRRHHPAIIDGATGALLWRGNPLTANNSVYLLCLGERFIGVIDNASFELRLYPVESPDREILRALSDEVDRYGVSDDCLSIRTDDHARLGLSLDDGSERSCDARLDRRPHLTDTTKCGIISTMPRGLTVAHDDMTYRVKARRPGTAFLEVSAKRGSRELWDIPLRFVPVDGEAIGCFVAMAAPGVVVVLGAERTDNQHLVAVGLNADSGTERYDVTIPGYSGSVREIYYNGRYVIVAAYGRIIALDPATGEIAWSIGQ